MSASSIISRINTISERRDSRRLCQELSLPVENVRISAEMRATAAALSSISIKSLCMSNIKEKDIAPFVISVFEAMVSLVNGDKAAAFPKVLEGYNQLAEYFKSEAWVSSFLVQLSNDLRILSPVRSAT
jgi:hypothetical protein